MPFAGRILFAGWFSVCSLTSVYAASGEFALGVVSTSGNSNSDTFTLKASLLEAHNQWAHGLALDALRETDNDRVTNDRYRVTARSKYQYSELNHAFAQLDYEKDRFSGYDYRATAVLGGGRRVLAREGLSLDLEAGIGHRHSQLIGIEQGEGDTIGRLALLLDWKVSETSTFKQELSTDTGGGQTLSRSGTSLESALFGNFSTRVSLTLRHNTDAVAPTHKLDSETNMSLVYKF